MSDSKIFWDTVQHNCTHFFEAFTKTEGPLINRQQPDNQEIICNKCFITYKSWQSWAKNTN